MLTKEILINLRLKCIGFFKEAIYMNKNASYLVSQSYQFNLQKLDIAVEIALPIGEKLTSSFGSATYLCNVSEIGN